MRRNSLLRPVAALAGLVGLGMVGLAVPAVNAQELVTLDQLQFFPAAEDSPVEIAVLWGDPVNGPAGIMLRLPADFTGPMHFHDQDYHAIVVKGLHQHWREGEDPGAGHRPGTYFFQAGAEIHGDGNPGDEANLVFIFLPDGLNTTFVE